MIDLSLINPSVREIFERCVVGGEIDLVLLSNTIADHLLHANDARIWFSRGFDCVVFENSVGVWYFDRAIPRWDDLMFKVIQTALLVGSPNRPAMSKADARAEAIRLTEEFRGPITKPVKQIKLEDLGDL